MNRLFGLLILADFRHGSTVCVWEYMETRSITFVNSVNLDRSAKYVLSIVTQFVSSI